MSYVIAFPKHESLICGFPSTIRLTAVEGHTMARIHLGGMESLRTPTFKATCNTVASLMKKGLLGNNGPTDLGKRVAQTLADDGVV